MTVAEQRGLVDSLTGGAPAIDPGPVVSLVQGEHKDLPEWGITKRTCEEFDYVVNGDRHFANYRDSDGLVVCQHIRTFNPKGFRWLGRRAGVKPQLFGQHLGNSGHLIITEGEKDALATHESLTRKERHKTTVVSVPDGAQSAHNAIVEHLGWIGGFDKVTIMFDSDEPGIKASARCAEIIGPKARIVTGLGYKDAADAHGAGDDYAIRRAISQATGHRPAGIVCATELTDNVLEPKFSRGLDLPWLGWNTCTEGLKPGELWLLSGGTGIGKSLFSRSMALRLASNGVKVAYLGYEESVCTTYERMLSESLGRPFHLMDLEERKAVKEEVLEASKTFAPNLFLIDKFGSDDFDTFLSDVKHYVLNEQCSVVFLDHFSILADGVALTVDQRRAIDKAIKDLKTLAMQLNFTFVVVCHLSRNGSGFQSHEEGGEPTLAELRGSQSLAQIPDYIWMLQRQPTHEDADQANITKCWLKKNRVKGEVGHMASLQFIPRTCRFVELTA